MIEVNDLIFNYSKDREILHKLNFSVKEGEIFGFLGPNGSGKSTTQKILTGLLSNYSGKVVMNGESVKNKKTDFYENIGVLFEFPYLYNNLNALDNLNYYASFYPKQNRRDVKQLLSYLQLNKDYWKKPISSYSKGMKQRVSMARALINNPKLLFLDEPVSGLDPAAAIMFREVIKEEKEKGTTIFLTTHNMVDADILCDQVGFISKGTIVALDSPSNLKEEFSNHTFDVEYILGEEKKSSCLKIDEIGQLIEDDQIKICKIHSKEPTLEDVFMHYTGRRLSQ